MTIKYVSNTASNGYVVGNDANNGTSPSTPYLTLDFALAHVSNGDTINVNDGTQTAATFFSITNGITLRTVTDYGTTLVAGAGTTSRVINVIAASSIAVNIGKFIVDTLGLTTSGIVNNSGTTSETILSGTKLQNSGASGTTAQLLFDLSTAQKITLRDIIWSGNVTTAGVYVAAAGATKRIEIDGITGGLTNIGIVGNTGGVLLAGTAAGARALVRRVVATVTTNHATTTCGVIHALGVTCMLEKNLGLYLAESQANSNSAPILLSPGNFLSENSVIRWNRGRNLSTGGYLIRVGTDAAGANDNQCNYPVVHNNRFYGNPSSTSMHGIFLANIKGGCVTGNTVSSVIIPYISKLQTERSYWVRNRALTPTTGTGGCLKTKGSVNTTFVSNEIYLDASHDLMPIYIGSDPGIPTVSTGVICAGNIVYSIAALDKAVTVETSNDASFSDNNWVSPSVSGTPWSYTGTTYATLDLWGAARELTARNVNPIGIDPTFWKDKYLQLLRTEIKPDLLPLLDSVVN